VWLYICRVLIVMVMQTSRVDTVWHLCVVIHTWRVDMVGHLHAQATTSGVLPHGSAARVSVKRASASPYV
jgi:hypothetical protein